MFAMFCFEGPTPSLPISCNHAPQSLDTDSLTGYKTFPWTTESLTSQTKSTTLFVHCCPHGPVEDGTVTTACLSSETSQRKHLLPSITPSAFQIKSLSTQAHRLFSQRFPKRHMQRCEVCSVGLLDHTHLPTEKQDMLPLTHKDWKQQQTFDYLCHSK